MKHKINLDKMTEIDLYSKSYKEWPQIVALSSACLASISSGNLFSFPSPTIPKLLTEDYNITLEEASYLTVIPPVLMIFASPIFCKLADIKGRKYTLLTTGILYIISWLLVAFARNIYLFYAARVVSGIGDASLFASLPTYIAEVTTPKVRSTWGNALIVTMFTGQFLINFVGFYLSIQNTAFLMLIFPILFLAVFVFMPRTPYFLIIKGNEVGAEKSLRWLRGCENVQEELQQLICDVKRQLSESGTIKDLWTIDSNRKALVISNLTRGIQQFSGISCFVVYSQYIFMQAGGDISSGVSAMIFSGLLAFVNIFANILSDKLGRRNSMIVSCFGCGVALVGEGIYFFLQEYTSVDVSVANWFPVFGLVAYVVAFCVGLGVVPTLMLGEIFSASIRGYAVMVSNMVFGLYVSGISKLFQVLMSSYGIAVPMLFFCVCCFLGSVLSYFVIPETKGKTLEQIQQMLKGN